MLKDSATDLKPFGLDKPQGKITIQSPEFKPGPTLTLLIGKAENKLLYVRNSTEPFIYTVPDNAFDFLPANNLALRDARAINLKMDRLKSMTITAGTEPPVTLARSPGGTWSATNVKDRMVDSLKADPQSSLFCQLQAKTWLGPVLPAYGLAKPVLTIAVQADQPAPTVLHIGAALPDGSHAAQIEGESHRVRDFRRRLRHSQRKHAVAASERSSREPMRRLRWRQPIVHPRRMPRPRKNKVAAVVRRWIIHALTNAATKLKCDVHRPPLQSACDLLSARHRR